MEGLETAAGIRGFSLDFTASALTPHTKENRSGSCLANCSSINISPSSVPSFLLNLTVVNKVVFMWNLITHHLPAEKNSIGLVQAYDYWVSVRLAGKHMLVGDTGQT